MGDDNEIAHSARVSYQVGTKSVRDNKSLIRYLMRCGHLTPFEHNYIKFHFKVPIFVARQIYTYRASVRSEQSARFSIVENEFYVPEVDRIKPQSNINKQGSNEQIELSASLKQATVDLFSLFATQAHEAYDKMIESNVARELARMILPQSMYTQFHFTMNLRNIFHFLSQRLDEHTQWETRQVAKAIANIVKKLFPIAYQAFVDYQLESVLFSKQERMAIRELLNRLEVLDYVGDAAELLQSDSKTERAEFEAKLKKLLEN